MKKTLRILPALIVVVAAFLCLSFDNNGKLVFLGSSGEQQELLVVTTPAPTNPSSWKVVLDICPDGKNTSQECQSGGHLLCTPKTCPPPPAP